MAAAVPTTGRPATPRSNPAAPTVLRVPIGKVSHDSGTPLWPCRGLHPATMTGIVDRLERAGWVARERDPADRRAVLVRPLRERGAELFRLYGGMNRSLDEICAGYSDEQLMLLADFLSRTTTAGRAATEDLSAG